MYHTWLDIKYANLMSSQLTKFKVKSNNPYLANCRCPVCGDSKANQLKARGYIYQIRGKLFYRCHNCGVSWKFSHFLEVVNPTLFSEFLKEKYINKDDSVVKEEKVMEFAFPDYLRSGEPLSKLKKVSQLPWNHPVKMYVKQRLIPNFYHAKLFYAPKFNQWTNTMVPGKLNEEIDEPRLVIPFFDKEKNMFGFQGRSFHRNITLRYISILLDRDKQMIYGLDTVDISKKVYVVEGPIDSMFLDNSIAVAGAGKKLPPEFTNITYILDNEPRNLHIVKYLDSYCDLGYNVCIWPNNIKQKDINEMVLSGMEAEDIQSVINTNTFSGLMAKAKIAEWRKV